MKNRGGLFSLSNIWALRMWAMAGAFLVAAGTPAFAQNFGLGLTASTPSVTISNPVTFTINLTNLGAAGVFVTNSVSGTNSFQITSATTSVGTVIASNSNFVVFSMGSFFDTIGSIAQMNVAVRPTSAGTLTNAVVVVASVGTNLTSTNITVQVTPPVADLAVSLRPPSSPVLVNDHITYSATITNLGTNTVSNVILTNGGFGSMKLLSLSPTNQSYTLTNGLLILNAGTFTNRAGKTFTFFTQPTNAGPLTLSAAISVTNIVESNLSNNIASTNITVEPFATNDLVVVNASAMTYNPQTGLMEQLVNLANNGSNGIAAARVIVSGLSNRLYNAVGTNNGDPFVVYNAPLAAGANIDLLLEYFVPTRLPITVPNSAYTAVAVPLTDLVAGTIDAPNVSITNLGPAGILIEFAAITNRTYTIYYSPDVSFSTNALTAQPPIVAPANRVQWIDNGPPKTVRHPTADGIRYYRVLLNP